MQLSTQQINNYTQLIKDICHKTPNLYSNKTFEICGLSKEEAKQIKALLDNQLFIQYTHISEPQTSDKCIIQGNLVEEFLNIDEDIELHDKLNPKIWTEYNELLPEVEEKIYDIVDIFKEQLAEDGVDLEVSDIYILGSNANYNYTNKSDLDVHIIADESMDCDEEHLDIIYNAYKRLFNSKYDITFNGINVEVYVENKDNTSNASSGIYSLNSGWIKNPATFTMPKIDEAKLEALTSEWESKYLDIEDDPSIDAIDNYLDDIYALRAEGIKEAGDFGLGNLVFKEIRNLGYLDNLKNLRIELQNNALSI